MGRQKCFPKSGGAGRVVNFAHKCTKLRTGAAGLGFGDRRDGALRPETARLPAGDRGGPAGGGEGGAARPGRRTRLRQAPVEPWKNPGAHGRGGPARKDGGNKGGPRPDAVMEKPNGAPGRGRQGRGGARPAALPPSPAGLGGAASSRRPGALPAGGGGGGPGKQKMLEREGRPMPGARERAAPTVRMLSAARRRKGGPGWYSPGTRSAAHGHLAPAAAGGGQSVGGAHRPAHWPGRVFRVADTPPAHTGSFTRTCAQTRELPIAPRAERRKGRNRRSLGRSRRLDTEAQKLGAGP